MINVYQPTLGKEELDALKDVFESNWLGKGKRVAEFEEKYAEHLGSSKDLVLTTNCCTEGLFSSMHLLDIQPGDEVIVDIYGASQFNGSFVVAPDGSITIPNEGPVSVAGLTVSQAQARVSRAIGGHYQDSTIKLSVGQTRTVMVNVLGEVKVPGTYTLSAFATVFNALYLAADCIFICDVI